MPVMRGGLRLAEAGLWLLRGEIPLTQFSRIHSLSGSIQSLSILDRTPPAEALSTVPNEDLVLISLLRLFFHPIQPFISA